MTAFFQVDPSLDFNQHDDIMVYYKEGTDGLCNGLNLERARHILVHKLKGAPSSFNAKLKANTADPSPNFLGRVKAYQDNYRIEFDRTVYRTNEDLAKLLDNPQYADSEMLAICFKAVGKVYSHVITLDIEHGKNGIVYKVFDPNMGESIAYYSKAACLDVLIHLKLIYLMLEQCENITVTARDLGSVIGELGIVPPDGSYTKDTKYAYKMIEAISKGDLAKIHGDLGVKTKLDYTCATFFNSDLKNADEEMTPMNAIDLAIIKLDEADLVKLININTQMDLTKSLDSILWHLHVKEKDTPAVLDALIAKLPKESHEYKRILEGLKHLVSQAEEDLPAEVPPEILWLYEKYVERKNDFINFALSVNSDEDINHKHLYLTEDIINHSIELHQDKTFIGQTD